MRLASSQSRPGVFVFSVFGAFPPLSVFTRLRRPPSGPAQGGPTVILGVFYAAPVVEGLEAREDFVIFGGRHHIFGPGRKNFADRLLRRDNAVRR